MSICSTLWNRACEHLSLRDREVTRGGSDKEIIKEAHQKLTEARNLFAMVDDPEMIDYAIYKLKAAEKRYDYLIKLFKRDHLQKNK